LGSLLRIKALAQIGLNFDNSAYDRDRYEEMITIADELVAGMTDAPLEKIRLLHQLEESYITPKVDVRTLVLSENKILLIKERADGLWALPGGWADVGYTPSQVARKEVKEETGLDVEIDRLLAVFDNSLHDHPPSPFCVYKLFFLGAIQGGSFDEKGHESLDVGFYAFDALPPLSEERNTMAEITSLMKLAADPQHHPALFD